MSQTQTAAPRRRDRAQVAALARGGLANLVGAMVSAAANFVLTVLIARYVSPALAGVFFTATSLFLMLATVGRLGADIGAVYFVARWRARGQVSRIRAGLRSAYLPVLAFAVVLAVAMIVFAPRLGRLVGASAGDDSGATGLLRLLALALPVAAVYEITLGASRGFGWMRPTVLVEKIGRPLAQLVLVTVVLAASSGQIALGLAWALPYLAAFAAAWWLLRGVLDRTDRGGERDGRAAADPAAGPELAPVPGSALVPAPVPGTGTPGTDSPASDDPTSDEPVSVAREFWTFTAPRAAASIAQIVLQRLDIVLVAVLRGPADAAVYTAATRFLVVGQFVNSALTAPVQPALSAALATGDLGRARELYRISTGWLVLASWPIFGAAAALATVYMSLFGPDYRGGVTVVVLLSLAMVVATGIGLVDTVIIMAGRSTWNLATTLLALVVNVSVDLALIPHLGLLGAALGWCASILVANLTALAVCWRALGLHPFAASTALAYALAGACWLGLPWLVRLVLGDGIAVTVATLGVVTVGYLLACWHWRSTFDLAGLRRRRTAARTAPR